MKLFNTFLTLTGLIASQVASVPHASHSRNGFPHTDALRFNIDERTHYAAGSNSYWIGFLKDNQDIDHVFAQMQQTGLKVLRVWGFNDVNSVPTDGRVWYQVHSNGESHINRGPDGLQRMDYVVSSAEKHDVKLIINFVNNWDDYGGMDSYVKAYGGNKTDWYTNEAIQKAYQNYIEAVISRYRNSPAVFAWELANEPRCKGCDTSVVHDWIVATSGYIKSLDCQHMVCIGDEGFGLQTMSDGSYPFSYTEGVDFEWNIKIPTIDFGTFHLYPNSWGTELSWGNLWVEAHGAVCTDAGKPCLFEEYGVTENHCAVEAPWQHTALQTKGVAADLYWQYGTTLSTGPSPDDGNTIYYGTDDFQCLVTKHIQDIRRL